MSTLDPQLTTQLSQTSRTSIPHSVPVKVTSGTPPATGQQMAGEVIPPPQGQSTAASRAPNTTWVQLSDGRVMSLQTERPLPAGTQISVTGRQDQQVSLQVLPQQTGRAPVNIAELPTLTTANNTARPADPTLTTTLKSPSTALLSALVRQLPESQQQQLIQRLSEISQPQATQQTSATANKSSATGDTQSLLQLASQQLRQALPVQQSLQQTLQQITTLLPQLKTALPDLMPLLQNIADKVPKGEHPPSAQDIKHWINSSGPLLEARMAQGKGDVQQDLKLLLQRAAAMLLQQASAQSTRAPNTNAASRAAQTTTGQPNTTQTSANTSSTSTSNTTTTSSSAGTSTNSQTVSSANLTSLNGPTPTRSSSPNSQASQLQQAAQRVQSAPPASLLATMTPPSSAGATTIRAALLQGALAGLNQTLGSAPSAPAGTASPNNSAQTPGIPTPNTLLTPSSPGSATQSQAAQSQAAQAQEALRQALGGALARIQVQQHTALQQTQTSFDRGQPAQVLQTDIPYMVRNEWHNAHLDIRRLHINDEGGGEGTSSDTQDRPWQVRLRFELNDWGVVHTHLVLRGERLKADVWVEEASAYQEMQSAVESLASRLRGIGAEVDDVNCHIGTPPNLKAERPSASGLIDTHI